MRMNGPDIILKRQVQKAESPSVHYLIFTQNEVLDQVMYGYAQIENAITIKQNSTYNAFSVSKTFTALALLQLAEQNLIDLESPVQKYLAGFPYPSEISIRQLLSHTSGIPNPVPLSWIHLAEEHAAFDSQKFFLTIFRRNPQLSFPPGRKFAYSNLGYVILGWLIEKISGLPYEKYIQQNIISQLNISPPELGFRISDNALHVTGYHEIISFSYLLLGFMIDKEKYFGPREGKWKSFRHYYVNGPAYGGLIGSPIAFMNYLRELLNPESILLSPGYKKMLLTETYIPNSKPTGMCLSWFTGKLNEHRYFTHAGGGGGYYCEIRIYPEAGIGSLIFLNRSGFSDERLLDKVDAFYFPRRVA